MILINVYGVYFMICSVMFVLCESCGHLVLMFSVVGCCALLGLFYLVTKFLVMVMGEVVRLELNGFGVWVMVIELGMVATFGFSYDLEDVLIVDDVVCAVLFVVF